MRKVYYLKESDEIKKLMIYESSNGIYLFGYNDIQDKPADWDQWFINVEDAKHFCMETYKTNDANWIMINDPLDGCQHDFIVPTKTKDKEQGKPEWGHFLRRNNNTWTEYVPAEKDISFAGMTVNERLYITGLMDEFDRAMKSDKAKAVLILKALNVDDVSVEKIASKNTELISTPLKIYGYIVISIVLFCFICIPLANIDHSDGEQIALTLLAYGFNVLIYVLLASCIINMLLFWKWVKKYWPINLLIFLFCIYMLKDGFWIYIGG
jgi:hypothetical protein